MATPTIRSVWSGPIKLGRAKFYVSVKKLVQSDPRSDDLKRLCSCCSQPFTQDTACPKGNKPWSAAAEKRGEQKLTPIAHGIEVADGQYVVIDEDVLEDITEATALADIAIEEFVDRADEATPDGFPIHLGYESYYVAADKKVQDSEEDFAALVEALSQSGRVAVARWSPRGGQRLVGLHVVGGILYMTCVPFGGEVRDADDQTLRHQLVKTDRDDVAVLLKVIDKKGSSVFDHDAYENDSIPQRMAAIDKALAAAKKGRKPAKLAKAAGEATPTKGKSKLADLLDDEAKPAKAAEKRAARTAKRAPAKPAPKKAAAKTTTTKTRRR